MNNDLLRTRRKALDGMKIRPRTWTIIVHL